MENHPKEQSISTVPERNAAAIVMASIYGWGLGAGIFSYLARSDALKFQYRPAFEGAVTVIDALGYPKQQEVWYYALALGLTAICALAMGTVQKRKSFASRSAWTIALIIMALQSPLFAIGSYPGVLVAATHIGILCAIPFLSARIPYLTDRDLTEMPIEYKPVEWFLPCVQTLFVATMFHTFITMKGVSLSRFILGAVVWVAVLLIASRIALYLFAPKLYEKGIKLDNDAAWFLIPATALIPAYQFMWGAKWFLLALTLISIGAGYRIYSRNSGKDPGKVAFAALALGIGLAFHISPIYRFGNLDWVHEGQQLAFAWCVQHGLWPGAERAVKYGPLYEFSEGWTFMLFGARVTVLRMYGQLTQVLGFFFCGLCLTAMVKRRWIMLWGLVACFVFSIAVLYQPVRFNGLRAGLPLLAIFLFAARRKGGGVSWLIGAGVAGAVAQLYSVEFGLAGVVALIVGAATSGSGKGWRDGARYAIRETLLLAAGAAVVVVPLLIAYASKGAVLKLISGLFEYASGFASGYGAFPMPGFPWLDSYGVSILGSGFFTTRAVYYLTPLICSVFFATLCGRWLAGNDTTDMPVMLTVFIYAALSYRSAMGRSDFPHLVQTLPGVAICLAIMLDATAGYVRALGGKRVQAIRIPAALAIAALLVVPTINVRHLIGAGRVFVSARIYKNQAALEESFGKKGFKELPGEHGKGFWMPATGAASLTSMTDVIANNTRPGEPVHLAPLFGAFHFFADRPPLSGYCMPIDAVSPKTRAEMLDKIKSAKPRVIFMEPESRMDFQYNVEHKEEVEYVLANYREVAKRALFKVYLRNDIPETEIRK